MLRLLHTLWLINHTLTACPWVICNYTTAYTDRFLNPLIFCPNTYIDSSSQCSASLGRSCSISSPWLWRLMIRGMGSPVHLSPLTLPRFLCLFTSLPLCSALAHPYSPSRLNFPSLSPWHHTSIVHSATFNTTISTTWSFVFFLLAITLL